jgi:hypothetical protein
VRRVDIKGATWPMADGRQAARDSHQQSAIDHA